MSIVFTIIFIFSRGIEHWRRRSTSHMIFDEVKTNQNIWFETEKQYTTIISEFLYLFFFFFFGSHIIHWNTTFTPRYTRFEYRDKPHWFDQLEPIVLIGLIAAFWCEYICVCQWININTPPDIINCNTTQNRVTWWIMKKKNGNITQNQIVHQLLLF